MSVLIINTKLHKDFRLVPTSVALNDLERRNSLYLRYFTEALQADYVTMVEDRPMLSAEYRLPLLTKTDPPCSSVSLR